MRALTPHEAPIFFGTSGQPFGGGHTARVMDGGVVAGESGLVGGSDGQATGRRGRTGLSFVQ